MWGKMPRLRLAAQVLLVYIRSNLSEGKHLFLALGFDLFFYKMLVFQALGGDLTDLLAVFEVLIDTEKLVDFEDRHGLIIGGVRCGM